jgi:hypothetical protein
MMRYSLRTLFALTAVAALALAPVARFVENNRADWKREQAAMLDGAVRWDDDTYIPNLDLGYTCSIPEWLAAWLPWEQRDVFYRVTSLDFRSGSANPDDLKRCLPFQDVNAIYLGPQVDDAPGLVALLRRFPQLSVIYLEEELEMSTSSIPTLLERELPGVQVVIDR